MGIFQTFTARFSLKDFKHVNKFINSLLCKTEMK